MSTETHLPPPALPSTTPILPPPVLAPPTPHQLVDPPPRPIAPPPVPSPQASTAPAQTSPPPDPALGTPYDIVDPDLERRRMPKIPFELFLILVASVILLAVFVVLTGTKRGDAESGRADAEARVAIAESSAREMAAANVDLTETNSELEARVADLEEQVEVEVDAREVAEEALAAMPVVDPADVAAFEGEIDELTVENTELRDRLSAAEQQLAAPVYGAAFAQYVGELLSSSPLPADQAQCLGTQVIASLGLDGVGAGLNSDRTTEANDAVTASMNAASAVCGINPQLIFEQ